MEFDELRIESDALASDSNRPDILIENNGVKAFEDENSSNEERYYSRQIRSKMKRRMAISTVILTTLAIVAVL